MAETTIFTLVSGHSSKLPSKYLSVCQHVGVVLNPYQKKLLLLQWMTIIKKLAIN